MQDILTLFLAADKNGTISGNVVAGSVFSGLQSVGAGAGVGLAAKAVGGVAGAGGYLLAKVRGGGEDGKDK